MLLSVIGSAVVGYAAGDLIAPNLEICYSAAPLHSPYWGRGCVPWLGTVGYLLAHGSGTAAGRLPARFCYLPVLGAIAGPLVAMRAVDPRHAILLAMFATLLAALAATDLERHLLPNRLVYPALAVAALAGWAWPGRSWLSTLEGGAIAAAVMLACFLIRPRLGFGDVKLTTLLGLLSGASHALPALAFGIVAGGAGAVALVLARRAGRGSLIAYGPYLALGAFAGMLMR